jgi:GT2 family glycosyltransferase
VVPEPSTPFTDVLTAAHADLLVVDNGGDYRAVAGEEVIRNAWNTGWAAASNLGFRIAFSRGYTHAVTLNSDTRLSPDFFAGLMDPRLPADAGLIGPMYDQDSWSSQASEYRGPAAKYIASQNFRSVSMIDGTCVCIARAAWERVGGFDEQSFGRFAWGADIDLALRARQAGFGVYVTEAAYLNHFGLMTVRTLVSERRYRTEATWGLRRGMRRLHGRHRFKEVAAAGYTRFRLTDVPESTMIPIIPSGAGESHW